MEQSTKTILWIMAFITLPLTIPLAIISGGMILSVLYILLCIFLVFIQESLTAAVIVIIIYGTYKWLSRNG